MYRSITSYLYTYQLIRVKISIITVQMRDTKCTFNRIAFEVNNGFCNVVLRIQNCST